LRRVFEATVASASETVYGDGHVEDERRKRFDCEPNSTVDGDIGRGCHHGELYARELTRVKVTKTIKQRKHAI